MPAKPRILLLSLEFPQWVDAAKYSYECNFGLEEGFGAQGIGHETLPVYFPAGGFPHAAWQDSLVRHLQGRRFDQVWFEATHLDLQPALAALLPALAPVRVAMLFESMTISPGENPEQVPIRQRKLARNLELATHVVAVDELDCDRFNAEGRQPALWWAAGHLPARLIAAQPLEPVQGPALFHGTPYGDRARWLGLPSLAGRLVQGRSRESELPHPARFDQLSRQVAGALGAGQVMDAALLAACNDLIRQVRRETHPVWLASLTEGLAVVNLPQFGHAYASRVTQAMAAGRPVVSWRIPGRPRTRGLFAEGQEILLFDRDDPEELAAHLKHLAEDPAFGQRLAAQALDKMRRFHTTERFVAELLRWIEDGRAPDAGDGFGAGQAPSPAWLARRAADGPPAADPAAHEQAVEPLRQAARDDLARLQARGVWQPGQPLKLHLGCGQQRLEGYVNIDHPSDQHNVMQVRPDHEADILQLRFPPGTVDEIRLHHVFEHFSRANALALLIRWHGWLKPGGRLHIETPDLRGSAEVLLSDQPWPVKSGTVRHLAGDQAAAWAYHVDHWFPERFQRTLTRLGFEQVQTVQTRWPHPPHLCNVHALAVKGAPRDEASLLAAADELLWDSVVSSEERPTHEVWRQQLRAALHGGAVFAPAGIHVDATAPRAAEPPGAPGTPLDPSPRVAITRAPTAPVAPGAFRPLAEVHDFNQRNRDRWVQAKAASVSAGARVLDVGAGTCVYRPLFAHCDYRTHDFKQYEGAEKLGNTAEYGQIDYVSDILAIPVPDASQDVLLCTEVLEHVPEPIRVLKAFARMLKPGGRAFITAPLGSGLHQLPYHYYGGYAPAWYQRFATEAGLQVAEITANGGFFRHLAQECARAAGLIGRNPQLHGQQTPELLRLLRETLPQLFDRFDDQVFDDRFTVGYLVELRKPG